MLLFTYAFHFQLRFENMKDERRREFRSTQRHHETKQGTGRSYAKTSNLRGTEKRSRTTARGSKDANRKHGKK